MKSEIWKTTESITRTFLRCMIPAVILVPLFSAALHYYALQWNLISSTNAVIYFTLLSIVLFAIVIAVTALFIQNEENKIVTKQRVSQLLLENRKNYAIFMLDENGVITSWNAGAERLIGYKAHEIIGKNFSCLFTDEDQKQQRPIAILEFAKQQKQTEYEGWRVHKDGHQFWATVTISALFDDQGRCSGFTKLMRNSTRQKEADEKLKHLIARLEKSNKELEHFAHIASHDLQEPLRMVASFTQLLAKKYQNTLDDEAKEYIHFAVDGSIRMQQLITDLVTYSRVSTKGKPFAPTDCNTIVEQAKQHLRLAIEESKANITHDELPVIMADSTQMLQVFQNLISNAIKFHNFPPKVHITATKDKDHWIFSIQDNGIGIAEENHENIFAIFHRLHGKDEYKGTGIGLAICKKIIDRHGGKIWVDSEPGRGAKFCFTIPN